MTMQFIEYGTLLAFKVKTIAALSLNLPDIVEKKGDKKDTRYNHKKENKG